MSWRGSEGGSWEEREIEVMMAFEGEPSAPSGYQVHEPWLPTPRSVDLQARVKRVPQGRSGSGLDQPSRTRERSNARGVRGKRDETEGTIRRVANVDSNRS